MEELENLVAEIQAYNYVYSDYYMSIDKNQLKMEYVVKRYPIFFEAKEFHEKFDIVDVYSDDGGAPDTINIAKQSCEKVLYKFDEIRIIGTLDRLTGIEKISLQKEKKTTSIQLSGFIEANTYNETITDFSNRKKQIVKIDSIYAKKILVDCLEIWSLRLGNKIVADELMSIIKTLIRNQDSRNYEELYSIEFLFEQSKYFEIKWNSELKTWEDKRAFDLWEITKK